VDQAVAASAGAEEEGEGQEQEAEQERRQELDGYTPGMKETSESASGARACSFGWAWV